MHLTLHQRFVLDHTHLAITHLQRISFKRPPKYRGTREKWERVRSVSLAPGSVPRVAFSAAAFGAAVRGLRAVPGLLLPSRGSAGARRSLRGSGSALGAHRSRRNLHGAEEPSKAWVNITGAGPGVRLRLWGAAHTPHTPSPAVRVMGGRRGSLRWGSKAIFCLLRYLCGR